MRFMVMTFHSSVHLGNKLSGFIYMYYNLFNLGLNNFWVLCIEFVHMHFKNAVSSIFQHVGIFQKEKYLHLSPGQFLQHPCRPT